MKKAIKLLSLAMLFAMPLAACNAANGGNGGSQSGGSGDSGGGSGSGGGGSGSGGGGSGGGGGGSSLTAKGEATRIAAEMYEIDEDEVTFADYEDEEAEADVYKYESSKLSFYMTGYWDDSMSYDEMVSDIKSFMPSGAKKNSTYSYGEEDLSEDDFTWIYYDEVYTKDSMAYNVIVDYYEDDDFGIDATASICVVNESQLAAYAEYFDFEENDDWEDDDDDEGGGTVVGGSVVIDFSEINQISGKVSGISFSTDVGSNANKQAAQWNSKGELRLYIGNTLTLSGATFTSIEFDANSCGESKADGTLSCSTGKLSGFTWTGSASSVTFTVASGKQVHISSITVSANGAGGGSGDEGGGGGQVYDDGEAFFREVLEYVFGYEPVYDEDYWDDDGLFTLLMCDDLVDDIDEMYDDLSQIYDCAEPAEDDGFYGFYLDSDDGNYYIDIYSGEDETDGNYIEMDLWEN